MGKNYRLSEEGQDFFVSYDEVYDSFDSMGLKENLLRGIYAYGMVSCTCVFSSLFKCMMIGYSTAIVYRV